MFSVVIPVYNHRPYLTQAVLSASISPLVDKILLLDDGSSDGSHLLARQLGGGALPKVRDVTPPGRGNRGAHVTLNELCRQVQSEWIAVLNSDDVFTPDRFATIHRHMRKSRFDLIFGNLLVIDGAGYQLGGKRAMYDPQLAFPSAFELDLMVSKGDWLPLLAQQNFFATTSNMVFRKSLYDRIDGFADLRYVHDWDFCLRAALEGKVDYLPHALVSYRVHSSNTIKEDGNRVDLEVRALFDRLQNEYPHLRDNRLFAEGLAANPYFAREVPTLSVVLPSQANREAYSLAIGQALQNVEITDGAASGLYIFAPDSIAKALRPAHLQNALLALEFQEAGAVVISHDLFEAEVRTNGVANSVIRRRGEPGATSGAIVARLFPGGGSLSPVESLLTVTGKRETRSTPLSTSLRSPPVDGKPVMFILPAVFAVGGVERLIIDMMRQLSADYQFVMITVERLHDRQGALHGSAEGLTIGFYDLAELAPSSLFLPMMERLREVYKPALVWVPNGSPWQCDNAGQIRRIFSGIPIVDQEAYDTEAGWITRYDDPGIRSYDRFIAINRKIEDTMIRRYRLPAERIDMIYHSVNLTAVGPMERTPEQRSDYRLQYGLPEDKQIFGFVGRFTAQKRPLEFIRFVERCLQTNPDWHFVMIGDGELSAAADEQMDLRALTNITRVRFSDHMGELFAVMDGLLSASEYEGLPISMLEALAMGVPVYSTDVGDVALVLEEYGAGMVTPAEWNLDRYTEGFLHWTENLPHFTENAKAASPRVRERFGSAAVAAQYRQCFKNAQSGLVI